MKPVPKHIIKDHGSAHEFRRLKRMQVLTLERALADLRTGCAYFPCGSRPIDEIAARIEVLKAELSVKVWGR